jgi:hypothetical protein
MTELDLYKFCQDKEIDWRGESLILWVYFGDLKKFTQMVGYLNFSDGGMKVTLLDSCVALELNDLCDSFGIDPENILKKTD